MVEVIFDSSALITCCKFTVQGCYIMEHILRFCEVFIPDAVGVETCIASEKYPDATVAEQDVAAVKSRYPEGFIYHTLQILERGDRRCLR